MGDALLTIRQSALAFVHHGLCLLQAAPLCFARVQVQRKQHCRTAWAKYDAPGSLEAMTPVTMVNRDPSQPDAVPCQVPADPRRGILRRLAAEPLVWAVVLAVTALALRLWSIGDQGMWVDELFTMAQTVGSFQRGEQLVPDNQIVQPPPAFTALEQAVPWWQLWKLPNDCHPPVYIMSLRLWRHLLGPDDVAARSLSALCSGAAVLLIFLLGRDLAGAATGLWAAAIMATSSTQIWYGQETRPYAMLLMVGLGAALALARIERRGPTGGRLVWLGVCFLVLPLIHYFSLGLLLAMGLYALAMPGATRRRVLTVAAVAAVVFVTVWGPSLWQQRHNIGQGFLLERGPGHVTKTLLRIAVTPLRYLSSVPYERFGLLMVVGSILIWLATAVLCWWRRQLWLPTLWLVLTIASITALDLLRDTNHLHWIRYVLLGSPAIYLLVSATSPRWRWWGHVLPAACLLVSLLFLRDAYRPSRFEWRGLGLYMEQQIPADALVVFAPSEHDWYPRALCLGLSHYCPPRHRGVLILKPPIPRNVIGELRRRRQFWVVADRPDSFLNAFPSAVVGPGRWAPNVACAFQVTLEP
jgi:4-amino-4-deoxy-L-arabinose transferase-like glycosyltransferase